MKISKQNHMKPLTSLLGMAALTFATSAFAQQEETASPAPEETPSTTIEETPTPTPAAEATATASPVEQPAAQKKEKNTIAPQRSPSLAAAASAKKIGVEAALKEMENKWEVSIVAHDTSFLQSAVASDFVGVSSEGKFMNKSRLIAEEIKNNKDTYTSAKTAKLHVRVFGPNIAVVTGTTREKGTAKDGKVFDRTYAFTDTWMERNGQWQCIASQDMLLGQR
jgi:ketosteroid isomerase-like protein